MRMHIPRIGNSIQLLEPWTFPVFLAYVNIEFLRKIYPVWMNGRTYGNANVEESKAVTLPVGTVLKISRIYIRQGKGSYDSVTFTVTHHPDINTGKVDKKFPGTVVYRDDGFHTLLPNDNPPKKFGTNGKFWAKLTDVNLIEFVDVLNKDLIGLI